MTVERVTEKRFQQQVVQLARLNSWTVYHTYDSRRSEPGFPDLVLVRDRVLFRELKAQDGRLSRHQRIWIGRLKDAGADVEVWRPNQWDLIAETLSRKHLWSAS